MVESIGRAESSFRTLAEDAQDGIIVFSGDTAVYANRRAAEMTGYGVPELTGIRFDMLFRPPRSPCMACSPTRPPKPWQKTAAGRRASRGARLFAHSLARQPAVAVLVRDITGRKREEETARLQQQHFMRMDKLTSLGVLAAGLAHEISVPNQVILSNATLLSNASPQLAALLEAAADGTDGHLIAGLEAAELRDRCPGCFPQS